MDAGDFSRLSESFPEFIEYKTRLYIGPIHRPPIVSKPQLMLICAALLILFPFMVKKVISGETLLTDPKFWLTRAMFVYFFSVSGAMHNIIRKMPMFLADRNDPSKLVFFCQGSGMQLGAEGFAVRFLYTIVGLLLAFMTHVLTPLSLLSLFSLSSSDDDGSSLVTKLLTLQSQSDSGIINLTDTLMTQLLQPTTTPRPSSLLIFFDASQLHNKHELHLKSLS